MRKRRRKWLAMSRYRACRAFLESVVSQCNQSGYQIDREFPDVVSGSSAVCVMTPFTYQRIPVKAVGSVDVSTIRWKMPAIVLQTRGGLRAAKNVLYDLLYDVAVLHFQAGDTDVSPEMLSEADSGSSNESFLLDVQLVSAAYCAMLYLMVEDWEKMIFTHHRNTGKRNH